MKEKNGTINNVYSKINGLLEFFSGLLMVLLVLVVLFSVCSRYIFNTSIAWSEELSRFMMIWMVCIGSVLAYVRSEHLGLDILVKMVPDRVSKIVVFVGNLFILFITGLMTVGGYQVVLGAFESVSPAMRICLGYVYIIVPICSAILCLITLHRVVSQAMRLLSRKEEGKEGLLW